MSDTYRLALRHIRLAAQHLLDMCNEAGAEQLDTSDVLLTVEFLANRGREHLDEEMPEINRALRREIVRVADEMDRHARSERGNDE
jgi:enamine deaminase RidA (YjgF/YER057c/UK114 family)